MKPQLFKLPLPIGTSMYYSFYECDYFERPWHFHKEFELVYILKSTGTKFIGNKVQSFQAGDLTLIGADIPHLFKNDELYYEVPNVQKASSIFIHFEPAIFGEHFFSIPEFRKIIDLLDKATLGLQVVGDTNQAVLTMLKKMKSYSASKRIISLLEILLLLSDSKEVLPILEHSFISRNFHDTEKINKIYNYILQNYTNEIYLGEIANEFHMSASAFSRYFKKHTQKTFSEYVTEVRINHACKLMMSKSHSISEIGFMSGFENRANFYRHFKRIMGKVPKDYFQVYKDLF